MAIESIYWKEELARIARQIRPVAKPKRWSERLLCTVERDLMIGFFMVRRMMELQKVSSATAKHQMLVYSTPATKPINKLNRYSWEENYRWDAEVPSRKAASYVANQCIHAYLSVLERGADRNWSDLLVVSDYDRNDVIWRIPFSSIREIFDLVARDYPAKSTWEFDASQGDYRITNE
jgi:hypothetical protein